MQGVAGLPGPVGPQGSQGFAGPAGPRGADVAWQPFSDIQFDFDKADVRPFEAGQIARLAAFLQENPSYRVELEGFADPRGSEAYNKALSTRRVNAVCEALVAAGIARDRIAGAGYGKLNPKCTQDTESCWQEDRRVEVIVLPRVGVEAASLHPGGGK
jgi:peptidoglycan-associated lipoprotein